MAEELLLGLLTVLILLLSGSILFSGGGIVRRRQLLREITDLRAESRRLAEANEALRNALSARPAEWGRRFENMLGLVKELENLKLATEGSSVCQRKLVQKYNASLGPELLGKILSAWPEIDPVAKRKLADESLVGDLGKAMMRSLSTGASLEKAASDHGVSVVTAKRYVTRLQVLGYLDGRLKPTELGREALT